ncbi:TolC family outer membrane protein [Neptuniibacter sp. 1_MG-2023]|uniref:TolC family outer membrane protein n=1 Tax=Neptuniibacter sp. 1_MG-2023 TaxID=3062662 RepID=UPI0026E4925C|nr:TolC family outer membrane protein [Neptuniibacter sp. 1_MG-2023]MDO6593510.1 TolC family outer membrane protein [Neptuniibacter sp. 1_MG-2023]
MKITQLFQISCLTLAVSSVLATSVNAGQLADIYQLALNNDPQLKAAEAAYNADKEIEIQSRASLLPSLSLSANTTSVDSDTANYNNHGYTLALSQPVFNAASWFTFKQGKVLSQQASLQFDAEQQTLISRTVEAYLSVLRAKSELQTLEAQERAIKRRLDQVNAQFEVGLIANTDVQEAQASYDNARVARISAEGDLDNSYEELARLTGQNFDVIAELAEDYPIEEPTPTQAKPWLDKAMTSNLNLKIANLATESARRAAQAGHAGHYPTLSLSASYDYDNGTSSTDYGIDTSSIGLTLSVPLYSGGSVSSKSRELEQRLVQTQFNKDDTLRAVIQSTRSLLRDLRTGALSVRALKQSIKSSEIALQATEEGYNVGTRNVVDVLQAEQQLYTSKRDYATARFNFVQNLITFKQQIGTLSPEDINELDRWLE